MLDCYEWRLCGQDMGRTGDSSAHHAERDGYYGGHHAPRDERYVLTRADDTLLRGHHFTARRATRRAALQRLTTPGASAVFGFFFFCLQVG